jgi:hypothetical protein
LFLVHRFLSPWWRRRQVPPKRRFLQEPHGVTTQKTLFFRTLFIVRNSMQLTQCFRNWICFRLHSRGLSRQTHWICLTHHRQNRLVCSQTYPFNRPPTQTRLHRTVAMHEAFVFRIPWVPVNALKLDDPFQLIMHLISHHSRYAPLRTAVPSTYEATVLALPKAQTTLTLAR